MANVSVEEIVAGQNGAVGVVNLPALTLTKGHMPHDIARDGIGALPNQ
jgi:hypothetical protein